MSGDLHDPMRRERILKPEHPIARRIVVGYAAEEEEISPVSALRRQFLDHDLGQCRAPPRLSETTEGARGPADRC